MYKSIQSNRALSFLSGPVQTAKIQAEDIGLTFSSGPNDTLCVLNGVETCTQPNQAANKAYVDSVARLVIKESVVCVSTQNETLSQLILPYVMNGVTLNPSDRVLLRAQTLPAENGIYVMSGTPQSPATRSTDMAVGSDCCAKPNGRK